jgi:hypothetical protein
VICREETAPGSARFPERRRIDQPEGAATFLCAGCEARASQRRRRRLTDDELRRVVQGGSLETITGLPRAH